MSKTRAQRQRGRQPSLGFKILVALVLLLVSALLAILLGAVSLPIGSTLEALGKPGLHPSQIPAEMKQVYPIVWYIRLPRAFAAILAGAALAASGAAIQGLFRNPLASPDVLGISAGSSLAAVLAIVSGASSLHVLFLPAAAFLGAIATGLLVYMIATSRGTTHLLYLVLAGLAVSSLLSGLVSGVLVFAEEYALSQFIFWTMGGLEGSSWERVLPPLPFILILVLLLCVLSQALNILSQGEEEAFSLGVPVKTVKMLILFASSALTALAVAIAGPIAFVGLMVPHAVRLLGAHNYKSLIPLSALAGSSFLLLCDLLARTILAPRELKTGVLTAIIGGPYFIMLILRHRKKGSVL